MEQFREEVLSTVRKRYGITDEDMYELLEQCKDEEFNNLQFDLMRKNVPSFLKKIQNYLQKKKTKLLFTLNHCLMGR